MIMCRELTDEEILNLSDQECVTYKLFDGKRESPYIEGTDTTQDVLDFARALFEAARIQQTVRE